MARVTTGRTSYHWINTDTMTAVVLTLFGALLVAAVTSGSWALPVILLAMPVKQVLQGYAPVFISSPALANYLIASAAGLGSVRALVVDPKSIATLSRNFLWWGIVALNIWCVVSCAWTPAPESAAAFTEVGIQYAFLFFFCAPWLIATIDQLDRSWGPLLAVGCVVTGMILFSDAFALNMGRLSIKYGESAYSNTLALGEMGGLMIIVSLICSPPSSGKFTMALRLAGFICGAAIALYSGSRGQVIFSLVAAALALPLVRGGSARGVARAALAAIVLIVLVATLAILLLPEERSLDRWEATNIEGGVIVRVMNAADLVVAFLQNPYSWFIGLGFNAFAFYCSAIREPYSHNLSLDVLCELGIPAFVLLCAIYVRVARDSILLLRATAADTSQRRSAVALISIAVYEFLLAHKQGFFWSSGPMFFAFILIGKLARSAHPEMLPSDDED